MRSPAARCRRRPGSESPRETRAALAVAASTTPVTVAVVVPRERQLAVDVRAPHLDAVVHLEAGEVDAGRHSALDGRAVVGLDGDRVAADLRDRTVHFDPAVILALVVVVLVVGLHLDEGEGA